MKSFGATFFSCFLFAGIVWPQTPAAADRSMGEVTSIDAEHRGIVLKEDKGAAITVTVGEKASLLRIPPGETDLKKAARITFGDIGVGDRLLAVGAKSGDKVEARTVVIMNKADIAQKQQRDQEEWQKRGIGGAVASVDSAERIFVVTAGEKKYTVTSSDKAEYRRYAADSAKYSDSRESGIAEMKAGDQVRVLGNKDEEALRVTAERVVFGTFARVAGIINSVSAETGAIKLTDLLNKKAITIQVTPRSNTRRLPEGIANLIAQRFVPGTQSGPIPAGRGGAQPAAAQSTDLSQLLDRLPTITVADLKPGGAIILTGTPQPDAAHLTAITVIAGIEPIVSAGATFVQNLIGGWNLGGGDISELAQ